MARGNDGNLLQHTVEASLALALTKSDERSLHLVATHGMRPFEPFDERPKDSSPSAFKKVDLALCKATEVSFNTEGIPSILRAYQACRASSSRYPNSIEIARSLISDVKGTIVEVVKEKAEALSHFYAQSNIDVLNQSWRLNEGAVLLLCKDITSPWLITLDPMIFVESNYEDDDKLRAIDIKLIKKRFSENQLNLRTEGAVLISCYSMMPSAQRAFKSAIELHDFPNLHYAETVARGGNRHVAAIAATDASVSAQAADEWLDTVQWLKINSK